mgnify:CR=1 FL=1
MKFAYNAQVDGLKVLFSDAAIEESDADKPGTFLDYDAEGNVVGMEILNASKHAQVPNACEFAVAS